MAELPELAGLDQLAREPDRGHEAVVEAAEMLDARAGDRLPDLVGLVGVAAERLLAEHVLAGLGGRDRRLGVQRVRAAVVEERHARVGDCRASRSSPPPAVALRDRADRSDVAPAIETSRGSNGGSSSGTARNAREWALPMNA